MAGNHPGVPGLGDAPFNAGGRRSARPGPGRETGDDDEIGARELGDEELRELLGRPLLEQSEIDKARKLVRAGHGVDDAVAEAARFGEQARAALAVLPPSDAATALADATTGLVASVDR